MDVGATVTSLLLLAPLSFPVNQEVNQVTAQEPFQSTDLLERLAVPCEGNKMKIVLLGKPRPREQRGLSEVTDHVGT